jgi:hypothetical protein
MGLRINKSIQVAHSNNLIGHLGFFFLTTHRHAAAQAYYSTDPLYLGNFNTCLLNNSLLLKFSFWQMECSWRFHSFFLHKIIVFEKNNIIFNISENNIISVKASKVLWNLCIHFWLSNLDPNLKFVRFHTTCEYDYRHFVERNPNFKADFVWIIWSCLSYQFENR